jgi:hypothetical protein
MVSRVVVQQDSLRVFEVCCYTPSSLISPHLSTLARSIPAALGSCVVLGAAMGTFDYAGEIAGRSKEEKEEKRKKFFKSVPQPVHHASE